MVEAPCVRAGGILNSEKHVGSSRKILSELTGATTRLQRQQEHAINAAHVMCNSMPP